MSPQTIAILMPGDMGHAVGRALLEHGYEVLTCLAGRGNHTCELSEAAGLNTVGTLRNVVERSDLILSILPPAAAIQQAKAVAEEMRSTGCTPCYVDCNAISPETANKAAEVVERAGAPFIDAGIIGLAPGKGAGPRFYVSGSHTAVMQSLDGKGFRVIAMGEKVGEASALKMVYAGLTKGTWTLQTAVLLAAQRLGVLDTLLEEFKGSQAAALSAMRARVPFLPADSGRWIGEMEEIASTFSKAGISSGFHDGATEIFRLLSQTPLATETRQTMDKSRTLEDALEVYTQFLDSGSVAKN